MKRPAVPIVVAVLAAALVGLLVYGVSSRSDDTTIDNAVAQGDEPAAPGPGVRLPRLQGTGSMSLADLRGKVVVLNFWASWCDPCRAEASLLQHAHTRLQRSGAGTVLGVTYKDYAKASREFVDEFKLTYPSLRDDKLDLAPEYGTTKLPETFVLNRDGRIVAVSRGQIDQGFLDRAIAKAEL